MNIEQVILRNILVNEPFMRKVLPFIKSEYFEGVYNGLFKQVVNYVNTYNRLPSLESFKVEIDDGKFSDEQYRHAVEILPEIFKDDKIDYEWLVDKTEKWCQDRAVYNAIMESISIIDGKHKELTKQALPELLSEALSVTFDANIGHDYFDDMVNRYESYHTTESRMPFDLEMFNKITDGGLPNKTLNICLAGTGVGKSLFMCHMGAAALTQGKNVLYITMEMSEEKISERIDANLLNIPIDQLDTLSKDQFTERVRKVQTSTNGNLIVKEYPTGQAHSSHFRGLLNELKLKKKFKPDIIFIDYLNICASSRMKGMGGSINSYTYIKAIAEELRGLAVEFNVPIISATQTTRTGFGNSDVGLEDTAESFGLPATADLMFALISTEELEAAGQLMVKQLKNRYNDPTQNKRFIIGVDRSKMRLMDIDNPTEGVMNDTPAFDNSKQGQDQKKFKDFKF